MEMMTAGVALKPHAYNSDKNGDQDDANVEGQHGHDLVPMIV